MKQELSTVTIDLAKKIFHLVGADSTGKILWRKRLTRHALMPFMAQLPPVLLSIEAGGGAHYWAKRFRELGHDVKLLAPQFVKPFVKSNKNDMRDAEAIAEAVTRPTMRFVPIKEINQQDIQALHRVRERLISERTALINEVHGLMHEYGIVMPKGVAKFRQAVVEKLERDKDKLTALEVDPGVCRPRETHRFLPGEARRPGHDASGVSASDDDPRDWRDHGDGAGGGRRRCGGVQEWPPVCRLVRVGAQAALHGWADMLVRDQDSIHTLHMTTPTLRDVSPLSILFILSMVVVLLK
jgi:hypothetical protein